jgi:hypothetical protein
MIKRIESCRSPILLFCLSLLLLATPLVELLEGSGFWISLIWAVAMLAVIVNASDSLSQRYTAIFLVSLWLISQLMSFPEFISPIVAALVFTFTIKIILKNIFAARVIDINTLSAAISVYLLIGIVFTCLFIAIFHIRPDSFGIPNLNSEYVVVHLMYYSFVTITTLGYGDILPTSSLTKMLAATEAIAGVFYIAILISRLVSLYTPLKNKR